LYAGVERRSINGHVIAPEERVDVPKLSTYVGGELVYDGR